MPVTLFQSADAGTNRLGYAGIKGVTSDLIKLLASTLILDTGLTETGASVFADQTTAWTQMGAGSAMFVANNATTDRAYFGSRQKFNKIIMQFATLGIGGTCTFEYWNGSAWVSLVSPTDGTTTLTAAGTLSWTIASQTGWAQTAINSITLFWVRVKWATAYSTNPVLKLGSVGGWGSPYQGTAGQVFRSQVTSGNQLWVNINDNGPGVSGGQEARVWGEPSDPLAYNVAITATAFPTSAQKSTGLFVRKSADTITARTWMVLADDKTFYVFILTADTASAYHGWSFGEFYSLVAGDPWRTFIAARITEASGAFGVGLDPLSMFNTQGAAFTALTASNTGMYFPKVYTGTGSSTFGGGVYGLPGAFLTDAGLVRNLNTFNGPDGGIFLGPRFVYENTAQIRGRLRGVWDSGHLDSAFVDGDTWTGVGAISTKTFRALKIVPAIDYGANANATTWVQIVETSDTWETN